MPGSNRTANKALPFLYGALLIAAVLAGYGNTLHSPFVLDDLHNIVQNPSIRIQELDRTALRQILSPFNPARQRPVASISFALNHLTGGYDTTGYHLVNIFIHLVASLLVFRLFFWYLRKARDAERDTAYALAAAAALLWAVNPIQTSAVTYIVQRMTSLCTLFFLSSLLVYLHARDLIAAEGFSFRPAPKAGLLLAAFILWLLAMLTKEIAVIMPALLLLHEAYFFDNLSWQRIRARKYTYLALPLFLLFLLGYALAAGLWQNILAGYAERDFTMTERLLSQPRVVLHYMSLFLWPLPSRLTLFYDFAVSRSLAEPLSTLPSLLAFVALVGGSCLAARRFPLVSFGLLWTLLCLVVESSILPLEMVFEHRFYLPSVGFALAVAVALATALTALAKRRTAARTMLFGLGILLTVLTHARNQDWRSEIAIHLDGVQKAPGLVRVANGLAVAYIREGRHEEALTELNRALTLDPVNVMALANLFLVYTEAGRAALADASLDRLKQSVAGGNFHCNETLNVSLIAQFLQNERRCDQALFFFAAMARCATVTTNPLYYYNQGRCYAEVGNYEQARASYESALSLDGQNPYVLFSLARSCLLAGDRGRAGIVLQRLQEIGVPAQLKPLAEELARSLAGG